MGATWITNTNTFLHKYVCGGGGGGTISSPSRIFTPVGERRYARGREVTSATSKGSQKCEELQEGRMAPGGSIRAGSPEQAVLKAEVEVQEGFGYREMEGGHPSQERRGEVGHSTGVQFDCRTTEWKSKLGWLKESLEC